MSVLAAIAAIAFLATAAGSSSTVVVLVPALISAVASVAAAWIGSRNFKNITRTEGKVETTQARLENVHTLVNGATATSMEALAAQTAALVKMTERRDELVAEREAAHIDSGEPIDVAIVKLPPEISGK